MKNFIANGNNLYLPAPVSGIQGGIIVKQGSIIGIAAHDAKEGDLYTLQIAGAYSDLPKAAGEAWSIGDILHYKSDTGVLTKTASGNTFAGYAYAEAAAADTTGSLLLSH